MNSMSEAVTGAVERTGPSSPVEELRRSVRALLSRSAAGEWCTVRVERRGRWFELTGIVDSQRTRTALFALIPERGGRRYVVDKLRVSYAPRRPELLS